MALSIDRYRAMLPTMKHRLDDELEIHAQTQDEISRQVTILNSRAIEAKDELARLEGRLAEDYKEEDPKLSISAIDAKVRRDPERRKAWQDYQRARSDHEEWSGLLDAWRIKGYNINTLAGLYSSQYFAITSTQVRDKPTRNRYGVSEEEQDRLRQHQRVASHRPEPEASSAEPTFRRRGST